MEKQEKFKVKEACKIFWKLHCFIMKITPYRLLASVFITGMLGILPGISVYVTQTITNTAQKRSQPFEVLLCYCLGYVLLEAVTALFGYFQTYHGFIINQKVDLRLTELVLEKTRDLELNDFESPKVYDLISRAKDQTTGVAYAFYLLVLGIVQSVLLIISNTVILMHLKEYVILIPLILLILFHSFRMLKISEKKYWMIKRRTNEMRREWYYQYLLTNDIAFKEIKLFGSHAYFLSKFKQIYLQFFRQDHSVQKEIVVTDMSMSLLEQMVIGGAFIVSMGKVYAKRMLIGDALAYIKGINNIKSGIQTLCTQTNSVLTQAYNMKLLFDFLEFEGDGVCETGTAVIKEIEKIEFKNVSFCYAGKAEDSLKNVSMVLQKGDVCVIVGKNGSGKSTFMKLLSGYYMNYSGEILINDMDLRSLNMETYRSKVSVLLQDFVKYEMTIAENMKMGSLDRDISEDDISRLLQKMGFPEELCSHTQRQLGYWFQGGAQISGGQWLKIALGRALLRDASLNVFDEPNAALDPASSRKILQMIETYTEHKISVVSLHHFDNDFLKNKKICIFQDGEILLQGFYDEIGPELEAYQKLYQEETETGQEGDYDVDIAV